MATDTKTKRHPGRRKPADAKTIAKHEKLLREAEKKRRDLEAKADQQINVLAKRIDKAAEDGVETKRIAEVLGVSRQMIYKLVRERVDLVPLGNSKLPKGAKGANGNSGK